MTDAQKSIWFGAAFVVVIALAGATLWQVATPNNQVSRQLAALNAKIDATNAALAKVQTAAANAGIKDKIAALDAEVAKTNATLTKLQKGTLLKSVADKVAKTNAELAELQKGTQLKRVADKLETLNAGIKSTDAALAKLSKSIPQAGLGSKIDAIGADLKTVTGTLAAIQQTVPAQKLTAQLAAVSAQIKSLNDSVAALQKAGANASGNKITALAGAVGDLQKNVDAAAALGTKLADQVAKLQDAAKAAAKPKPNDLVVVYLHMPNTSQLPKTVATVTPLTVHFERLGSTSDQGQAKAIIARLKEIVKGRKDCTISVVGYADTVGSDDVNLNISKKRAAVVADQLKAAFEGTGVQINQAAWGERRLKDWTPDRTPDLANRRVDIAVNCKG